MSKTKSSAITARQERLRILEEEIRSGLEEFYRTGMKLKEIRDDELYKEAGFSTRPRGGLMSLAVAPGLRGMGDSVGRCRGSRLARGCSWGRNTAVRSFLVVVLLAPLGCGPALPTAGKEGLVWLVFDTG